MSAISPSLARPAASTVLVTDLSVDAAAAEAILNVLYTGPGGTPKCRGEDSRALRTFCENLIGAENTVAFFAVIAVEY